MLISILALKKYQDSSSHIHISQPSLAHMSRDQSNMLLSCQEAPTQHAHERGMMHQEERDETQGVAFAVAQDDRGGEARMLTLTTPWGLEHQGAYSAENGQW